ncbi:MAG: Blue-light-activated protein [Verrucomicrobiales bacterium]|nr:Blue-light-activated protein [Verrucomicrobiales bacterium]
MPQFNAMEALQLLNQRQADIPFILVTGSQSEEVAVECMKEGADDYVLKATLKRLPSALQNVLKKWGAEKERQSAIHALAESEEHFRSLIENALDIIFILNNEGIVRYASPSIRFLGYKKEELIGEPFFKYVSNDDEREVREILRKTVNSVNEPHVFEFMFRHQNDSWRVLEAIGKALLQENQSGIVLNIRDVTERKQAEAEIEKLAVFPRLNPNPVFELGPEGRLTYFNAAAEAMARSMGKNHPSEILPEDASEVVEECLTKGQSDLHRETTIGNRILSWSFFPIITSQAVHCYAVDITERLNLEGQLRQSQKMESVGQLAAGVAHDFNNILTIIQGYSNLLLDRKDIDTTLLEPLEQIAAASERAANLTGQLLMFSRKQVIQPYDLDLNEVIANITKLLGRILGEDITLRVRQTPDLPHILGDAGMMEQIIMNLAINARDAMSKGGAMSLSTTVADITRLHVQVNPEARVGQFVVLRISDSGSGIPPRIMSRIFEPFFTTKEVGKGTGLGLATVYGIVKQHHGWIELLSEVNRGTTFRIYLPISSRPMTQAPAKGLTYDVRGGKETVLVVEDEPELRSLVREILHHYGYTVHEAASGPEAIPVWEEHMEQIDLLLTDMVMPGRLSGKEIAQQFQKEKPNLRVVYTTGYSVEVIGKDSKMKRGVNLLQKPYHPLALVKVVRDCLDSPAMIADSI